MIESNSGRSEGYHAYLVALITFAVAVIPLTACRQAPPSKVAKLMVSAASNSAGDPLDNLNDTPPEQMAAGINEWSDALKGSMGEDPSAIDLIQILTKTGELYPAGKFSPAESTKYAARARAISLNTLTSWQTAVGRFEPGVNKLNTIWFMVRQPAMFDGSKLNASAADRSLARLQELPSVAVERWASATDVEKGAAAFHLIAVDALFKGKTFQGSVFDSALPIAKELIQEKRSKRKAGGA